MKINSPPPIPNIIYFFKLQSYKLAMLQDVLIYN
jgi:hypothetical protein